MTVVLDTSLLLAFLHAGDPRHDEAQRFMRSAMAGELGVPVSCDYVLDEGLTFLRRRPGTVDACREFAALFTGTPGRRPILRQHHVTSREVDAARELFFARFDQGLSFTDCVLAVLARELGGQVGTFDTGFDGVVERVPR